jgi:hypothetical protein
MLGGFSSLCVSSATLLQEDNKTTVKNIEYDMLLYFMVNSNNALKSLFSEVE